MLDGCIAKERVADRTFVLPFAAAVSSSWLTLPVPLSLLHTDDVIDPCQVGQATGGGAWRGQGLFGSGGGQHTHRKEALVQLEWWTKIFLPCVHERLRGDDRQNVFGGGLLGPDAQRVDRNLTTLMVNRMVRAGRTNIIFQKLKGVGKNESCVA